MTALALLDVTKRFEANLAVAGVSMQVEPGERRVVIGPNGAGKTTLFHCIAGTHLPTSGAIRLFGRNIERLPPHARARAGLSRTFQITNLFPSLTLLDNILLAVAAAEGLGLNRLIRPLSAYKSLQDRALSLLAESGLAGPYRLVRQVSYGEQRQLEVALALALSPRLLLLDEPMAGLSGAERTRVLDMLRALSREVSILMIEHDMDVALAFADRVSVMHQGRVLAEGDSAAIRANEQVAEIYLGLE